MSGSKVLEGHAPSPKRPRVGSELALEHVFGCGKHDSAIEISRRPSVHEILLPRPIEISGELR
jgi:hypothetical protein